MNEYRYYKAFGLVVQSRIILDEFMESSSNHPDVIISMDNIPDELQNIVYKDEYYSITHNQLLLNIPNIGRLYIEAGKKINLELHTNNDLISMKQFLYGTAFGTLLLQRGNIPIHGSAIRIKDKCFIFVGDSGAGKSTISTALRMKGYKVLSDDVISLRDLQGEYYAIPSYPIQKITEETVELLKYNTSGCNKIQLLDERVKYIIPINNQFEEEPMVVTTIIQISKCPISEVRFNEITGLRKIGILQKHTYRHWLIPYLNMTEKHWIICSRVAKQVKMYDLSRPEKGLSTEEQIKKIMELVELE